MTVVGDGTQRRDFVHVRDVAEAFCLAAETSISSEVWNCGANDPKAVNELVQLIGGEVVYIPRRPGEPDCTWADTSKIRRDLGWQPAVSFREGVAEMLREIDRWVEAPLWTPESIATATAGWFKAFGEG
jgi:UDP-glucose 4-epimerase